MSKPIPITADDPPQFPCWLWSDNRAERPEERNQWRHYAQDYPPLGGYNGPYFWFTHWHPDQPDAPTERPDEFRAHTGLEPNLWAGDAPEAPTPRTDELVRGLAPIDRKLVDFARTLERELAAMTTALAASRAEVERLTKDKAGLIQDVNNLERGQRELSTRLTAAEQDADALAEQLVFSLKMSKHNPYFIAARHAEAEAALAAHRAKKQNTSP